MEKQEQKRLLAAALNGGIEEFAELFESFRPMLSAVAGRLVGPHAGDDVVMDTYLKAWRSLKGFRGRSSVSTWLCQIARNCALDYRRKEARRSGRHVPSEDDEGRRVVESVPDESLRTPQETIENRELGAMIQEAMEQLSDIHRTVIILREVDELSYSEIAAATGASIGTVMSRLFHARRQLRKSLERIEQ